MATETTWQDNASLAIRYLADAQLYPNIAKDDLEKAQFHIGKAIEAWYAKQEEKVA